MLGRTTVAPRHRSIGLVATTRIASVLCFAAASTAGADPAMGGAPDVAAAPAAEARGEQPPPRPAWDASDPYRVIGVPTALMPPADTWTFRDLEAGYASFEYSFGSGLALQIGMTVPAMQVGVLPGLRVGFELAPGVHLGAIANLGALWLYAGGEGGTVVGGGGPMVTFGSADAFLNLSLTAWGGVVFDKTRTHHPQTLVPFDRWDRTAWLCLLPSVGGSVRIHRMVRANVELLVPMAWKESKPLLEPAELWILVYGVRLFDERFFGDVGFALPLMAGIMGLMRFMPLGAPAASFGVMW